MRESFVFQIRTLSIEEGFELSCEGVLEHPVRPVRLIEAIICATQMAKDLRARIEIFDSCGVLVETIDLNLPGIVHQYVTTLAA